MVLRADAIARSFASAQLGRSAFEYFRAVLVLALTIAIASFVRTRGQGLSNVSVWIFVVPFVLTLLRPRVGLLTAVFLLTVTPALHMQLNALLATRLIAWSYPGVDACLGFLLGWCLRGQWPQVRVVATQSPAGLLIVLHAWIALSALVVVARNLWQSASEFSPRGLVYNVWITRGLSWLNDYYPLQDLFFYSVGLALLLAVWAMLMQEGDRLLRQLVYAVLGAVLLNAAFALGQRATGLGWADGGLAHAVNALWPDLHSFGAFMAVGLLLSYGVLRTQRLSLAAWVVVGPAMAGAIAGLFLSASRSTLLFVAIAVLVWAVWATWQARGWRRAVPVVIGIALVVALDWTLDHGLRGYTYETLRTLVEPQDLRSFNASMSHRPEIWRSALEMYSSFPLFGLGQGSFYRLSGLAGFSSSETLRSLGGSSTHNYFLQTFVELGPVAAIVGLLILVPCLRLGRRNFGLVSFYALAGIALGNLYAHSLLVRETLLLCAVFAGAYFWEAQALGAGAWRPLRPATMRIAALLAAALALLAGVEVARSFERAPFTYGRMCFGEPRAQTADGWASGLWRMAIPPAATRVQLSWKADRPDLERRPMSFELSAARAGGSELSSMSVDVAQRLAETQVIILKLPDVGSTRILQVRTSNCYVPQNLGVTTDSRRLGLILQEARFLTADGVETK
jgi:O-antigen ligase